MTYAIEGRNCELLRVELADGEGVIAEVGKLVYLRGAVEWNVVLPGRGFAGKVAAIAEDRRRGAVVRPNTPGRARWVLRVSIRGRFAPWSLDTVRK